MPREVRRRPGPARWFLVVFGCAAAFGPGQAPAPGGAPSAPPNLVVILVDDMGAHDWGGGGSRFYRTPAIDALATRGVRCDAGYAAAAVCSPSRAAILSGKAPARLHLTDWIPGETAPASARFRLPEWNRSLPLGETTLAEALRTRGYRCASIGKWHLGGPGSLPEDHGFDLNVAGGAIGHPASYFWPYGEKGASHRVPDLADGGGQEGEYLSDRLTDEAVAFVRASAAVTPRRPFFLWLAHYGVHSPLQAKPEDLENVRGWTPDGDQQHRVYAAMIAAIDRSVARLVASLEELGLAGNTVVVFTSDNGGVVHSRPPATSNAPLRLGKGYPYEGGLRVPLVVVAPGRIRPGTTSGTPIVGTDLFPTLLDLAGAPLPADLDGQSALPVFAGNSVPDRVLAWHYPHYWFGGRVSPFSVLRHGPLKLVRLFESDRRELYDLLADPGEQNDLAETRPADAERLSRELDEWLAQRSAQPPLRR